MVFGAVFIFGEGGLRVELGVGVGFLLLGE